MRTKKMRPRGQVRSLIPNKGKTTQPHYKPTRQSRQSPSGAIKICPFETTFVMYSVGPIDVRVQYFVRPLGFDRWIPVAGLVGMRPDCHECFRWLEALAEERKKEKAKQHKQRRVP
mgnify:CR=1 FL=1